ncbi:MAG: hypothetical protein EOM66_08605 [Clostridia bacterium]|nr:hypothetical protein [Clostridia bacterium]
MLCDSCKQNEAVIHRIVVINGQKHERHLCAKCAEAAGSLSFKLPSFAELMNVSIQGPAEEGATACSCGMTLSRFRDTGLLGCPHCYETFRSELMPVIERSQGGRHQHMGVRPVVATPVQSELEKLREELRGAVEKEDYEQAARLRDEIRAMEAEA